MSMEKLKVTVEFQNALCDRLYNTVEKAEFAWLEKYCLDKKTKATVWNDLIAEVNCAIYSVVKEFFDNSEEENILEKTLNSMLPNIDVKKILDGCK